MLGFAVVKLSSLCRLIWRHWTTKCLSGRCFRVCVWDSVNAHNYLVFNIWDCVSSGYPIALQWFWECIFYLIITIKSWIWIIDHCLGLFHEAMICAVCLAMFYQFFLNVTCYICTQILQYFVTETRANKNWLERGCRVDVLSDCGITGIILTAVSFADCLTVAAVHLFKMSMPDMVDFTADMVSWQQFNVSFDIYGNSTTAESMISECYLGNFTNIGQTSL